MTKIFFKYNYRQLLRDTQEIHLIHIELTLHQVQNIIISVKNIFSITMVNSKNPLKIRLSL